MDRADPALAGPLGTLVVELSRLPGIGQRTAQRLAFHILRAERSEAVALADAIRDVKDRMGVCETCFNLAADRLCRICADPKRDRSAVCVVEEAHDVIPIERTHAYHGVYHVLGGAISAVDGVDPDDLRIDELLRRVAGDDVNEVLIATNPTAAGDATAFFVAELLHSTSPQITVTRLASGLPVGADLEYADEVTLGRALAGRREL